MSDPPPLLGDPSLVSTLEVDWPTFLDEREAEAAPEVAFPHVEASLDSGVRAGMIVERDQGMKRFWLAKILSVHGPILRLANIGDESREIWHDLGKNQVYPLGWCQMNKVELEPPQNVKEACPEWQALALKYLEDPTYDTISMHYIDGDGVTAVDRLKVGMALEIRARIRPNAFWPVKIKENHGGLLKLQYMTEDKDKVVLVPDWHFYTSDRLFPFGYARRNNKEYHAPEVEGEDIRKVMDVSIPKTPADLIQPESPGKHGHKLNSYLEVLLPNSERVEIGVVSQVWDDEHFQVTLVSDLNVKFLCSTLTNFIFPLGYWEQLDKTIGEALKEQLVAKKRSLRMLLKSTQKKQQPELPEDEGGFEQGQKLEVLYKDLLTVATVSKSMPGVLHLELATDSDTSTNIFVPSVSTMIYPLGFSVSNNFPIVVPKSYLPSPEETQDEDSKAEEKEVEKPKEEESISSWCPPIYFNYQCYSASFLSKARLASLPKSVGPGSVYLVMKKVLELIIGSSYKSGSVLKRLETKNDIARTNYILETMKGKSRVLNLKANIEIPTRSDQFSAFCREICQKVGACPYLLSATFYDKECPANCQSKPKSDFHAEEQSGIAFRRRKGKKRKFFGNGQNKNANSKGNGEEEEDSVSDSEETEPPSGTNSRSASPDGDSSNACVTRKKAGRKEWETILPKSEIRTRGAKLPNYKLHLKIRPSKKDQRAIEGTSLRASIGYKRDGASKRMRMMEEAACSNKKPLKIEPAFRLSDITTGWANENGNNEARQSSVSPSFSGDSVEPQPPTNQPPPIREIRLGKNPKHWTCEDTARFLVQTADCSHLAHFMIEDDIDGESFMLLNYPTVKDYWSLTFNTAVRLCQHIESVKLAYYVQFQRE